MPLQTVARLHTGHNFLIAQITYILLRLSQLTSLKLGSGPWPLARLWDRGGPNESPAVSRAGCTVTMRFLCASGIAATAHDGITSPIPVHGRPLLHATNAP